MTINDRLRLIRESFKESQAKFGLRFGLPQTTYANYELNKRSVPDELKQQLSELGINLNWLITGNGPMFLNQEVGEPKMHYCQEQGDSYLSFKGAVISEEIPDGGLSVPIITQRLSAGPGQPWTQADFIEAERLPILGRFIKPWQKENVFAAEVRGDSMTGIQLFDGDMAFFAKGEVEGDGIYVLTVDNEVYIKRVAFNPFDRKVTIKSENDRYEPMIVDCDRVVLVGKVIGWLHHHPY